MDDSTRRRLLKTLGAASMVSLAGCQSVSEYLPEEDSQTGDQTPTATDQEPITTEEPDSTLTPTPFEDRFGEADKDTYFWGVRGTDEGAILGLGSQDPGEDLQDALVVKYDDEGAVEWSEMFGGEDWEWFDSAMPVENGYLIGGTKKDTAWLAKLSEAGEMEWEETYKGPNATYVWGMVPGVDGGYLIVGRSNVYEGATRAWAVKTDDQGMAEWKDTYHPAGEAETSKFSGAVPSDNGYLVAGQVMKEGENSPRGHLVRIDASGTVDWRETYGTGRFANLVSLDEGFVVAGQWRDSDIQKGWLLRIGPEGETAWEQTYDPAPRVALTDVVPVHDGTALPDGVGGEGKGGFVLAGWTETGEEDSRETRAGWIGRVGGEGAITATRNWTGGMSAAWAVDQTHDNGYVVVGYTDEDGFSEDDSYPQARIEKFGTLEDLS